MKHVKSSQLEIEWKTKIQEGEPRNLFSFINKTQLGQGCEYFVKICYLNHSKIGWSKTVQISFSRNCYDKNIYVNSLCVCVCFYRTLVMLKCGMYTFALFPITL